VNMDSAIRTAARTVSRKVLILQKHSPHILFGVGVVGAITSTVLACRATLKLSDTLDEIQTDVKSVKDLNSISHGNTDTELYPTQEYKKDITYVYTKAGLRITKLYAPSVIVGALSIAALSGSHIQMTKRNTALMAAYAAVQRAYDEYRERVRKEVGEDRELDIYHAAEVQTITNEDGSKEDVVFADPNKWSPYARFFDEYSEHWNKDPELNFIYVTCQQHYLNNLLHARGHVFLNEAYDQLGIPRSKAGQIVGWIRNSDGDNYVSFGIYEAYNARFVNGFERSILLDFNVDGVIYDKI
jgi:Family of unknown function (DUF6353)